MKGQLAIAHLNGQAHQFATAREAGEAAYRWVGELLIEAASQDGTWSGDVAQGGTTWTVHAYDTDRQVDVVERDRRGNRRVWTSAERRACRANLTAG